jgi:hypothetical protein
LKRLCGGGGRSARCATCRVVVQRNVGVMNDCDATSSFVHCNYLFGLSMSLTDTDMKDTTFAVPQQWPWGREFHSCSSHLQESKENK